jgi:hypothetical protein
MAFCLSSLYGRIVKNMYVSSNHSRMVEISMFFKRVLYMKPSLVVRETWLGLKSFHYGRKYITDIMVVSLVRKRLY